MPQSSVTFTNRVEDSGATPEGLIGADEINELKNVVNANASDSESRMSANEQYVDQRKSFESVTVSGSITKSLTLADPTSGDITLTLPAAATVSGEIFTVKRTKNGQNIVEVASADLIDSYAESIVLGHQNETLTLHSDGVEYWVLNRATEAFGSIATSLPAPFAALTSPQKLTTWDTDTYSTSGRILADSANNRINVIKYSGALQDGYKAHCDIVVDYDKDQYIVAQFYVDGSPVGQTYSVNGLGLGKPITISMLGTFGVTQVGSVEVWMWAESAGTINVSEAAFTLESILG